ncbi:acyltransferase [Vibrio cyclitrophicus]
MTTISRVRRVNPFKTLYYSIKYKTRILVGWNVSFNLHRNAKIYQKDTNGTIEIGLDYNSSIKTVVELHDNANLSFHGDVKIMKGNSIVLYESAVFSIRGKSFINEDCKVRVEEELSIGSGCAISWGVTIIDSDMHDISIDGKEKVRKDKINIGDNNLIGCNSIVLKGVKTGSHVIISAGSIVKKSAIGDSTIYSNGENHQKVKILWT